MKDAPFLPLELLLTLPKNKLGKTQIQRRQRYRLWKQNPKCHWCNVETIYIENFHLQTDLRQQNIWATIDHLYSRLTPELRQSGNNKHILSCWKCNNDRNNKELQSIPIEHRRKISGRFPSKIEKELDLTF